MTELSMINSVHFADYNRAGQVAENLISAMVHAYAMLEGISRGFIGCACARLEQTNDEIVASAITKENLSCMHTYFDVIIADNCEKLLLLYEECKDFYEKIAVFEEKPSSFRGDYSQYDYNSTMQKLNESCSNLPFEDVKQWLLSGGFQKLNFDFNQEINLLRSVWQDMGADIVCDRVQDAFQTYEQLFDDFQEQVKSCCDLIEQKEKEQQNTQEIKTEQVQEKSEEIEKTQELSEDYREYGRDGGWYDKEGYYRYENGTYFDPQGRFFDEFGGWYEADGCTYHKPNLETDKENKVLTNEETKKSYLVIDDEMTK